MGQSYSSNGSDRVPLIPARMVNEFIYCPRLAYLEWVQSEWESSADTVEGNFHHRRVDQPKGRLPESDEPTEEAIHAQSVTLSSEELGVIAVIDLVLGQDGVVTPVDYKRGKRPHVARGAYDPERVQLCIQGLLLRECGYQYHEGLLYFVASKRKGTRSVRPGTGGPNARCDRGFTSTGGYAEDPTYPRGQSQVSALFVGKCLHA